MIDEQTMAESEAAMNRESEALETKLREAEQQKKELEQAGWQWRETTDGTKLLAHPADPDINVWFHPYSGEQLLSPKLVQRLKEDVERERQGSEEPGDGPKA